MINTVAPSAAPAPVAGQTGPVGGKEMNKGPEQQVASQSNSVTNPIGVDYSIFSGIGDSGSGNAGVGGPGAAGTAGDAAAAAAAGTGDGFAYGGEIKNRPVPREMYRSIPSIEYQNRKAAEHLARQGRGRDTTLVHMSPAEVRGLGSLHPSGQMPINPRTGLPEADFLTDILPGIAGTAVGFATGMPWLGAVVSGLGTWGASGNLGKGILSGLLSFGLGELGSAFGEAGKTAAGAAAKAAGPDAANLVAGTSPDSLLSGVPTASTPVPAQTVNPTGFLDKAATNISNIPQTMSNIGQGIMSPQNWNLSKMVMPGIMAASGAYGLNQMAQQPVQPPAPVMPQQGQAPQISTAANPPRIPTGGVVPQGQNPATYRGELSYFSPNPAWQGYPSYASHGGQQRVYETPDGGSYELARGGVANLPSGMIRGPGGGMDDRVKGSIDGRRDVYLSDGEYVVDAQTVSALGDGSSEAGAQRMKNIVEDIRQKKFGSKKQPPKMASMGGLASLPFDSKNHFQTGTDGETVKGGTYRGPGILERWFGIGAEKPQDPERSWTMDPLITNMPSREEVDSERNYRKEGPKAGDRYPMYDMDRLLDLVKSGRISGEYAYDLFSKTFPKTKVTPDDSGLSGEDAYRFYAGKMLSRTSPVSDIGYDEKNLVLSPSRNRMSNILGLTKKDRSGVYSDLNAPSSLAHEFTHAGILSLPEDSQIRKQLTDDDYLNEMVTRAIMLRRFGDIEENEIGREDPQVQKAKKMYENDKNFKKLIQDLEREASHEGARRLIERQGVVR